MLWAVVCAMMAAAMAQPAPPVARTACGLVSGSVIGGDLAAFFSIPYAAPPTGSSGRWKPPREPQCWPSSEIFSAQTPGNICWQMNGVPDCTTTRNQSEDCLSVDVYKRFLGAQTPVPVIVWLHGGSLIAGYTTRYANLTQLALAGDIVLVSVGYRLNAFGFMAHPVLSSADPRGTSGNYGIMDQQAALRWVQSSIGGFGGDPKSVTVLGQSSGGTSIFALLSSPGSVGLFHGAISLSGSPNISITLSEAYTQNEPLIAQTACSNTPESELLICLYNLTALEVANMFPDAFDVSPLLPVSPSGQNYPGLPIVDGVTITTDLFSALATPIMDVPLVVQTMRAEMDTFEPNATIYAMTIPEYKAFLDTYYEEHGWSAAAGSQIAAMYGAEINETIQLAYQQWIAEYSFLCGNIQVALTAAASYQSPVYASLIAHNPGNPLYTHAGGIPALYPGHFWDYILATQAWDFFSSCNGAPLYQATADDVAFGAQLMKQWQNFAKFHDMDPTVMRPVNDVPHFPDQYLLAYQNNTQPNLIQSYGAANCKAYLDSPLNMGMPFWLTN